jgi:hypothetical protein
VNNQTWDLAKLPIEPMNYKWVFQNKCKGNGVVDCYKARFIARGFSKTYGVDFNEMYAHVVNFISI